jgi:endonuclease/exonuclease/phosphatase family metal-dependent hydrolase
MAIAHPLRYTVGQMNHMTHERIALAFVFFAFGSLLFAETGQPPPPRVVILSWNVENLFDADDDPANAGDDEYTPAGWTRWTEPRYRHKLTNLAEVVSEIKPDIFCLAEVENRRVLDDLIRLLDEKHGFRLPVVTHRDCGDMRGIDTALLSRFEPVAVNWLRPIAVQRDIIVADFEIEGRPFAVLFNHWKSRYGKKAESDAIRELEARAVRAEINRRLKINPAAAILVTGDFNDNVDNVIPQEYAGFSLDAAAVLTNGLSLFNLSATLPADARGTYYYSQTKSWNSFDMFNISRGLLTNGVPASPWMVRTTSFGIYAPPKMRQENGAPYPFRRVGTKEGQRIYTGYSDHFPVHVTVEARP